MMKLDIFDTTGKKTGKIDLPDKIFAAKVNKNLIAQAVRVYLANQRQGTASTKERSEVVGSRRKIWRQKGTGRARHGDRYAPIFVGGGIAHGPRPRDWSLKMPKKMRRLSLFSALTSKLKEGEILIIQGLEKIEPKAKKILTVLLNLKLKTKNKKLTEKTLLVLPEKLEGVIRAGGNIKNLTLTQANLLNTYQVLNGGKLVFLKQSIKVLEETFLRSKSIKSEIRNPKHETNSNDQNPNDKNFSCQ